MFDATRIRIALSCAAAAALAACTTPHVKPQLSQAVIDARAHRDAPPVAACPDTVLNALSPVMVGFGFGESELTEEMGLPLAEPARWLACHADTLAVIKPDADTHGTAAEQDALALRRAEGVRNYLSAHGVAAERIRILGRNEAAPGGSVFLFRAEGRRW
jgi:outer membrane protein OmpA-like peptidoglycan-associated protein